MIMLVPLRKTIVVEAPDMWEARHVAANQTDMDGWTYQSESGPIVLNGIIKEEIANFGASEGMKVV